MSNFLTEKELLQLIKQMDQIQEKSVQEGQEQEQDQSSASDSESSNITVENNRIQVNDTGSEKTHLYIAASKPIKLFKNGTQVDSEVMVTSKDYLEWKVDPKPLYQITISLDHMEAFLQVHSTVHYGWKLVDKAPAQHMVLEVEEDHSAVLGKLGLADVMNDLNKLLITKNVKTSTIYQEIVAPSINPVAIAHGVKPVESIDAKVEMYFQENIENIFQEIDGSIDFRNHLKIPTAKVGDVIARKIPGKPGTIGYDVHGSIIKPRPPKDITIVAKEHTQINDSDVVIALKNGRPRMTGTAVKYFDITMAHVVFSDVDIKTGNIVFSGDDIVYGNVTEGMIIESLGNVLILGSVYKSTITATGGIVVKGNIVNSHLYSGYFGVIFNRLYLNTKKMTELLLDLQKASDLLMNIIATKGNTIPFQQVIMTLVESKYHEIPKTAKEIIANISGIHNNSSNELLELKNKLQMFLHPSRLMEINSVNQLKSIVYVLEETYEMIGRMQESNANINISTCHLTEIKSNGDIVIHAEGVVQSSLYANGNVIFMERTAVCRGGNIESSGTISASFVGGEIGTETHLKAAKKIMLYRMNNGKLQIGKSVKDVLEPIAHVTAYVRNNKMVLDYGSDDREDE